MNVYIKFLLLILIFIFSTLSFINFNLENLNFRYSIFIIKTDSMNPTIKRGDLILIDKEKDYKLDDIVVFRYPLNYQQNIVHRIVDEDFENNHFYITKGDNNVINDPWQLIDEDIIGVQILTFRAIGYPIIFIQSEVGLIFLVVIPLIILIYSDIEYIFKLGFEGISKINIKIYNLILKRKSR